MILLIIFLLCYEILVSVKKALALPLSVLTLTTLTIGYYYIFPSVFAQLIPGDFQQPNNGNMTLRSRSTTAHTSYAIEDSNELLSSKLSMIKKGAISQKYDAMGIPQKGSNDTSAKLD